MHQIEEAGKAAHALHPDNAERREAWVSERSLELLRGHARQIASGLRRAATRGRLSEERRKPVDTAADSIENSQPRLRYDDALAIYRAAYRGGS